MTAAFKVQMERCHDIRVREEAESSRYQELFQILGGMFPVEFSRCTEARPEAAGDLVLEVAHGGGVRPSDMGASTFRMPAGPNGADGRLVEITVKFGEDPGVPFPFSGRSVRTKVAAAPRPLSLSKNERILATVDGQAVWACSQNAGVKHFRTAFALSELPPEGAFHDVLNEERFMEMLPLLAWLREICAGSAYEAPPLRACFIFDDPNLHWPRYGFADFAQIAQHATKINYHVSFATIPLDAWFTHGRTAGIFKTHATRISLAVHGNDHIKAELARPYSPAQRISLLRQAISRIERLERKTGLEVSRLMIPPHGACSEEMLQELPRWGFEAACVSHGSLRAHNPTRSWARNLGYLPSEMIRGCPVLPRWGLAGNTVGAILLAAFLGQPIILRGHHGDLRDGIEKLNELAEVINSLGPVSWSSLAGLSRRNCQWRLEGTVCRIRPWSRKVALSIPEEADQFIVDTPSNSERETWAITVPNNGKPVRFQSGECLSLKAPSSRTIQLEAVAPSSESSERPRRWPTVAPFIRRLLTEGRDRLLS